MEELDNVATTGIILPPNSKKPAGSTAGFYGSFYPQMSSPVITHGPGTSKYYSGYNTRDGDMESYASGKQGTFATLGNAIAQGALGEIVGLGIEGIGSLGELFELAISPIVKYDNDFNNIVMELGSSIREGVKEKFPIYRENRNEHFAWDDWAWWMEGLVSASSTVGLMLPSMGATKMAGSMVKYLGYLSNINKPISTTAKAMLKTVSSAAFMRNAENASESSMTYRDIKDDAFLTLSAMSQEKYNDWLKTPAAEKLKGRLDAGEQPTPENMAKLIAGNASLNQYEINAGNIVFDIFQMYPVYRMGRIKTRASLANADVKRAAMESMGIAVPEKSLKRKALDKTLQTVNYLKRGWSEAPEEVINGIAQEEGLAYGKALIAGKAGIDSDVGDRLGEYLTAPRIWEQGFYGWLGGQAFATAGDIYNKIKYKSRNITDPLSAESQIENIKERALFLNTYSARYKNVMDGFDYLNVDENGKPKPITGTPEAIKSRTEYLVDQLNSDMMTEMALGSIMSANKKYGAVHTGLVGNLLDWINSDTFDETFEKNGMSEEDRINFKTQAIENLLNVESSYKLAHGGIFEKVSDPAIANILINRYAQYANKTKSLLKSKSKIDNQLANLKATHPFYQSTFKNLTDQGYDVESTLQEITNDELISLIETGAFAYSMDNQESISQKIKDKYKVPEGYKAVPQSTIPDEVVDLTLQQKLYDLATEGLDQKKTDLLTNPRKSAATVQQQFQNAQTKHSESQSKFFQTTINDLISKTDTSNLTSVESAITALNDMIADLNKPSSMILKNNKLFEKVDAATKSSILSNINAKLAMFTNQRQTILQAQPKPIKLKDIVNSTPVYNKEFVKDSPTQELKESLELIMEEANDIISELTKVSVIDSDLGDRIQTLLDLIGGAYVDSTDTNYTKGLTALADIFNTVSGHINLVGANENKSDILAILADLADDLGIKASGRKPTKKEVEAKIRRLVDILIQTSGKAIADFTPNEFIEAIAQEIGIEPTKLHFNIIKRIFAEGIQLNLIFSDNEITDSDKVKVDKIKPKRREIPDFSSNPEINIWLNAFKEKFADYESNPEVEYSNGVYKISGKTYEALANILNIDENTKVVLERNKQNKIVVRVKSSGKFKVKGFKINQYKDIGYVVESKASFGCFYSNDDDIASWNHAILNGEYDIIKLGEELKDLFIFLTTKQSTLKEQAEFGLFHTISDPNTELSKILQRATRRSINSLIDPSERKQTLESITHMAKVFFYAHGVESNYVYPTYIKDGALHFDPSKLTLNVAGWTAKIDRDISNYEKIDKFLGKNKRIPVPIAYMSKAKLNNRRSDKQVDAKGRPMFVVGSIKESTDIDSKDATLLYVSKNSAVNNAKNVNRPVNPGNFYHWMQIPIHGIDRGQSKQTDITPIFYNTLNDLYGFKSDNTAIVEGLANTLVELYNNNKTKNANYKDVNTFLQKKLNNILFFKKGSDFAKLGTKQPAFTYSDLESPVVRVAIFENNIREVFYKDGWFSIDYAGVSKEISDTEAKKHLSTLRIGINNALLENHATEFKDINPITGAKESIALDGKEYNSYSEFLIDNGLIGVSLEKVVDENGKFMTNGIPFFNDTNLTRPIIINLNLLDMFKPAPNKNTGPQQTPVAPVSTPPSTSPTPTSPTPTSPTPTSQTPTSQTPKANPPTPSVPTANEPTAKESMIDFLKANGAYDSVIDPILDYLDELDVKFSHTIAPIEATYIADTNGESTIIQPGLNFNKQNAVTKFTQLIHEIIHGKLRKLDSMTYTFMMNDLSNFVVEFLNEEVVKELLNRVATITGFAYDNTIESLSNMLFEVYKNGSSHTEKIDDPSNFTIGENQLIRILAQTFINKSDLEEFITYGLTHKTLIDYLNSIEYKGEIKQYKRSFWDVVVEIIAKYLRINLKDSTYFKKLESIVKEYEPGAERDMSKPLTPPTPRRRRSSVPVEITDVNTILNNLNFINSTTVRNTIEFCK